MRSVNYLGLLMLLFITLLSMESRACHALGLQNPSINVTATGVEVNADSDPATCAAGCNNSVYWMDIEIRCVGEPFNPAPFNPGFYGPIFTYPFFQSAQMQKPNCVLQAYPQTFIPFGSLCPGDYQIRFRENHNGSVGPWTQAFVFSIAGTAPALDASVTTIQDTVCAGECTDLTANLTGGCGLAPQYYWNNGATTGQINVCPAVTTTYDVTITEVCSNTTAQASIEIVVIPPPNAGTASSDLSAVCEGETVELSLVGYEDDIQWETSPTPSGPWIDISGGTSDNITSPPITPNKKCFRARVGTCGTPSYSNTVCITVNPIPTIDAQDYQICDGESIDIETVVSDPGGNYLWATDGSTNNLLAGQSPSDTTFYPVEYELNGCLGFDTAEVVVFKSPVADFSVDSVCLGLNNSFIDLSTLDNSNGDIIDTWSWSFGDGNSSSLQNPSHQYAAEAVYETKLVITTNNGCQDSIIKQTAVYPLPAVSFDFNDACFGYEHAFSNNSTISNQHTNNSIDVFDWNFDDGNNSAEEDPTHTYTNEGSYDVELTLTSNNGCVDSLTETVIVHPLPVPFFNADVTASCSPLCFTLNSESIISSGSITNYRWLINDSIVQDGSASMYADCLTNNSTETERYDVQLITTSNQGCVDSVSADDYLSVFHNPFADFSYTPEYVDVIEPDVEFTNMSIGEDSVQWTFGTFYATSDGNPTVEFPAVGGEYGVELWTVTDEGCVDSVNVFIKVDNRILYFAPNAFTPDGDQFNQSFKVVFPDGFIPEDFNLFIYNKWGEVVFESYNHLIGWDGTYGTDFGRKADTGTYVWTIEFKDLETDKKYTYTGHVNLLR